MEIKITHLVNRSDEMYYYSASRAELGDGVGQITWQNAMDNCDSENPDADPILLILPSEIEIAKNWFADFGAWDSEEIEAWDDQEVNALLLQFIAGDIRESLPELLDDYEEYQKQAEAGQISGRIYKCDIEDNDDFGEWFIYIGN